MAIEETAASRAHVHGVVMRVPLHSVDYIPDGRYRLKKAPPKCGEVSDCLFDGIEGEGMAINNGFKEIYFVPDGARADNGFFFLSPKELMRIESA